MNIYDIAQQAGVSIATVSRVLNNKDTVSPATRAKVEAVLAKCNYTPSAIAQGMVSKSMRTVAVLTADILVSHYARTAYTIEREFSRRDYEVILCNTGGDTEVPPSRDQKAGGRHCAGWLCVQSDRQEPGNRGPAPGRTVVLTNGKLDLPMPFPFWWMMPTVFNWRRST